MGWAVSCTVEARSLEGAVNGSGTVFFEEAGKIVLQVDRTIQLRRQTSRGELSQLTIGFVSFAPDNNMVPAILQAFSTLVP